MQNPDTDNTLPDDEALLLSKISLGSELAFRVLFDRYRKLVYGYALKIIKSDILAEEILHDVFLKIWQHQNLATIEKIEPYLRTLTRNITIKVWRRLKLETLVNNQLSYSWEEAHNETEEIILLHDAASLLRKGINLLTPQQKTVFMLCKDEGLKYAQVAERLAISPFTVKTHMQQVLRFLRNYVSKHGDLALYALLFKIFY